MQNVDAAGLGIGDDHPTRIMGVLNVSRESPYDPSVFDDHDEAAAYVEEELVGEGADIVDVGLESANKRFDVLSAEQELDRLDTAIQTMESVSGDAIFSIETRYHEVAEAAIEAGFDMVNDICGFADPEMPRICREYDVAVGKMASPPDLERPGAVEETDWAARNSPSWAQQADYVDQVYEALGQNGLTDKTIVDPAFGGWSEAKTLANDRETFRRLREFRALDRPILVSINRKNFLRSLADRSTEEALPVSLAATSMAIDRGAHVVRTHDVAETLDAARIGDAFAGSPLREASLGVEELDVTNGTEVARHVEAVDADFDPENGTTRAFRITGLDPAGRKSLAAAAADTSVRIAGESTVVLFGTPRSLTRLAATLDDSGRVGDVMEWIANDV
ncbi:dihydropteroate synthase [Halomicrobium katesii]|uniref:dihydropteroate synthase n=1 Tax=Halomicrobium katesii TaxID=437163 RepID=UPI00035E8189|nr:dihydropteroate synthase [Halomicrobium katesii]